MSFSPPPRPYPADRYHAADGEVSARWRVRDAPNDLVTSTGSCDYLATGLTTNGDYGLYRWTMGPEPSGPAPHCHRALSESFFVLTGTIRLFDGTRWADGQAGRRPLRARRRPARVPQRVVAASGGGVSNADGCTSGTS